MPDKAGGSRASVSRDGVRVVVIDGGGTAMYGRDDLLELVASRLDAARDAEGRLALLSGEAGIGKTRLLRALEERAAAAGFGLWSAAAFPQDLELSAGLLLDLGHAMARSPDRSVAAGGSALVDELADVAERVEGAGDAHRRRRLLVLDAVERVAGLCADGPVLLALEDLHWSDELSLEVVAHLARRLRGLPMLVVGTLRTDELHQQAPARAWRARLLLQRAAEEFRLAPLGREQSERVVRQLLPGRPSTRLVTLLHERSGGVPLHLEELARAAAQGRLARGSGYVPETLAEAVQQRFEALGEAARDAAVAAAVVHRSFDLDLLAAVAGTPADAAADGLDELVDRHVVHEEAPGWFAFRHALIRDAVEANAPLAVRRALHARVAAVSRERPELGGDAYRSAHHEAAGEREAAVVAADAAAARAARLSAHREALDLLDRAVRCLPADDARRAGLLARRAVEAAATDHNARAAEDFAEARRLLLAAHDVVAATALLPGLVAVRHLLGDPLPARIGMLDDGLRDLDGLDGDVPRRVRAALRAGRAAAYLVADHLDDALDAATEALAAAGTQDEPVRLNTVITAGTVEVFGGRGETGWPRLEEATLRARELGLEAEAARGYRMLGSSASTLVEYDRAERWLAEGIEHAERTEQWNHRHYMASHQAHVWWCVGRWDDAFGAAQRVLADAEGGLTTRIIALHALGFVALGRGRFDEAAETLGEARASGEEMRELQRFSPALWGLAESAVLQGDSATAVTLTELGYDASHAVLEAANLFPFLVTGTRARLGERDPAAAQGWVDRVAADLLRRGVQGTLPAVDHAAGLTALAAGRTGQARERLGAAHDGWVRRGRWWEAQWCALDLARCAIASNRRTEAATLVEDVRRAATAVGAVPLLEAAAGTAGRLDRHDAPQPWSPLTQREFEVARLVARGMTNREIAADLRITARTAGSHLEHIRAKLGAARRSEIAAWATAVEAQASTSGSTR